MNHLKLSFLGTFQVMLAGKPLTYFRSTKVQGLLVFLALTPHQAHGRNMLAALFWPDEPETSAKQNLRQSLYRLRRLLGEKDKGKFLLITRSTVQFNPNSDHSLDVTEFFAALERGEKETAVSHYHGDLLPGFSCNSRPFDNWLRSEREQLHRLALDALLECTALSLTQGDTQKAQRLARQQLTLEPWREEAHQQLMQALALSGDRSGALAQYETCRRVLKETLGIEPTIPSQTLAHRIRDQQLEQQAHQPTNRPRRLTIPFVGRHHEYQTLVKAYQQAARGSLQVVSLVGYSGMGKTRLAQQFLAWAATEGADVLAGRAFATSAGLSYQPITHLFRQRIERENAPEDLLSDLWLSQLTRLLPELRDRYPDLPPPTQEANTARQHLFEAVTRLGQTLAARQPLILFIDDWHWADSASMDLLRYCAYRWAEEKAPILVLLTLRQEMMAGSPVLQSWLNQLKRTASTAQLLLDKLSQAEIDQLVQLLFMPNTENDAVTSSSRAQFSRWLFKETDGQPLFLTEALKVLAEGDLLRQGSNGNAWQLDWSRFDAQKAESHILAGVREIVQGWLTRISAPAGELLAATAVLAQAASFKTLCRVTALEEQTALTALEELLNRQLLLETEYVQRVTQNPFYTFSHQKVGEVVYTETGAARRQLLHRRAFEILQSISAPSSDLAHHALNAGLLPETIRCSLIAGNEAMALFATRVAITHYETAQQLVEAHGWPQEISSADRQTLFTGLGRAYELIEEWTKAEETYKAMITYAHSVGATAMECQGLNSLAIIYYLTFNQVEQAVELLESALVLAEQRGDRRGMAETVWNLAMAANQVDDIELTLHHAEKALALTRDLDHPQFMARHLSILSYIYLRQRKWHDVELCAAEASQLYTDNGHLVLAADSQRNAGFGQMMTGKPQEALATLEETAVFSRQIENLWGEAECSWKLAFIRLELGDYGQAVKLSRQGVKQAQKLNLPSMLHLALTVWGTVQRTMMALDSARETLLGELMEFTEPGLYAIVLDWVLAECCALHALVGNWGQAAHYTRQRLQARGDESLLPMGLTGWYETEALLRGGDGDLARAEVARLAGMVGHNRRYRLILQRSQAVLAQWDGEVGQAISHLQRALRLAQEIGLPGEAWPIWGELGELYGKQGENEKGEQAYREAGSIINQLAKTIQDEELRAGFLAADAVRPIWQKSKLAEN